MKWYFLRKYRTNSGLSDGGSSPVLQAASEDTNLNEKGAISYTVHRKTFWEGMECPKTEIVFPNNIRWAIKYFCLHRSSDPDGIYTALLLGAGAEVIGTRIARAILLFGNSSRTWGGSRMIFIARVGMCSKYLSKGLLFNNLRGRCIRFGSLSWKLPSRNLHKDHRGKSTENCGVSNEGVDRSWEFCYRNSKDFEGASNNTSSLTIEAVLRRDEVLRNYVNYILQMCTLASSPWSNFMS